MSAGRFTQSFISSKMNFRVGLAGARVCLIVLIFNIGWIFEGWTCVSENEEKLEAVEFVG